MIGRCDTKYFADSAQKIGWLFVLATAAGGLSVMAMSSVLVADDLLPSVYTHQGAVLLGHGLIFVMLTAMVGTAVLLYPILMAGWLIVRGLGLPASGRRESPVRDVGVERP